MNYVPSLPTVLCVGCGTEVRAEQLNENNHCLGCRVDLQMAIDKERAEDFQSLSSEALIGRVVERARAQAKAMLPTTYRLTRVIAESMQEARRILTEKTLSSDDQSTVSAERDSRVSGAA
jgi:hypothetical protein